MLQLQRMKMNAMKILLAKLCNKIHFFRDSYLFYNQSARKINKQRGLGRGRGWAWGSR